MQYVLKVFGDEHDFNSKFQGLDKKGAVFKNVQGIIDNLKKDVVKGERIHFKQIPRYYKKRHCIDNAYHVYLPEGMRLIYSITIYEGKKTAFLMELFLTHKEYDRRFD